ncbi:MAG: acyltransferase [candidate division WOR-3 bacterium]
MKLKYYYNLDGIRGIAALIVVVFHFFNSKNSEYLSNLIIYQKVTEFGQHGVLMFFVLSGFVITRILIKTRENTDYFSNFYKRRVLRIMPLYYLFLFIWYFFPPLVFGDETTELKLQLPFYFYIQNLTKILNIKASGPRHYWSLAVEEHFYLLWPLIIYFIHPKNIGKLIGISFLLIFLLKHYMLNKGLSINYFTFTRIDQIMMGAYLAVLELNGFFTSKGALKKMLLIGLSIFPISVLVYFFSKHFYYMKEMMKYPLLSLFFFSLIGSLIILNENNIINRILSGKILQYLGLISYGIYVWHELVLVILSKLFISKILIVDLMLTICLTIILAHLSYFYFEKFFLSFKDKNLSFRFKIKH